MLWQSNTTDLSAIQEGNMLQPKGFYISIPYQVSQHLSDICCSPAPPKLLLNPFVLGHHCTALGASASVGWAPVSPSLTPLSVPLCGRLHKVGPLQNHLQLLDPLASPALEEQSAAAD